MLPAPTLTERAILPAASGGSYFFNRIGQKLSSGYGDRATMLIMAARTAVGFVISYFLAPETKERSLSEASGV